MWIFLAFAIFAVLSPASAIQHSHSTANTTETEEPTPFPPSGTGNEQFGGLELFCEANDDGLQECSQDFINLFLSEDPFDFSSGEDLTDDRIFKFNGQFNIAVWNKFCNASYGRTAACVSRNNLLQQCPNAAFVKAFRGIFTLLCDPESKPGVGASLQCLNKLFDHNKNFTDAIDNCVDLRLRRKRQIETDPSERAATLNSLCEVMQQFVQCGRQTLITECGRGTLDFLLEISQNAIEIFNPKCNLTGNGIVPQVTEQPHTSHVPGAPEGCMAAGPCFGLFFQMMMNNSIAMNPTTVVLIPNITMGQFSALCNITVAWDLCIDQSDARIQCPKDASIKLINNTINAMCREPYYHVFVNGGLRCVNDLVNQNPKIRQCIAEQKATMEAYSNGTTNLMEGVCSSSNELYTCARETIEHECGADIYIIMVEISRRLLETLATARGVAPCTFAPMQQEKTTLSPDIKKSSPAVGELKGEVSTEKTNAASVNLGCSMFMLIASIMLIFWQF